MKLGREYYIGGIDRKGVMLRRVWGTKPNKPLDKVLLWAFDKMVTPQGAFLNARNRTVPFYFYITFDQKNGSGMYFCNSYWSAQVGKLYFQVSDDDNKISSMIEFTDGIAKEGNLQEIMNLGPNPNKATLDALDYYQGVH
jgi:hypothetical protein